MYDNGVGDSLLAKMDGSSSPSSRPLPILSPPSTAAAIGVNGGLNCIVHRVSKFDTLAGVAIKYGVEVADIKRLNGLATDLQMFALKTLHIPLPGRHPPSPSLSDDHHTPHRPSSSSNDSPTSGTDSDILGSFQSLKPKSSSERKTSSAMSTLQGYYGLISTNQNQIVDGFEMTVYQRGAHYLEDVELEKSSTSNPPLSHHRKAKSVANGLVNEKGNLIGQTLLQEAEDKGSDTWIEKLTRRISKADFTFRTPEKLLKEENSNSSAISAITGKGLALRPKSSNRAVSGGGDGDACGLNAVPSISSDSLFTDSVNGVRKSPSTSSLQEPDNGTLASLWPTSRWSLKPDFQALSTAAITRPIFDGLPKPMGRRNKAALD